MTALAKALIAIAFLAGALFVYSIDGSVFIVVGLFALSIGQTFETNNMKQ